jgi:ribosomal protein L30
MERPAQDSAISTNSNSLNASTGSNAKYLRVKLCRGLIGLPDRFKEHVRALGLRHTHQKSYVDINPKTMGNILKVKELVQVKPVMGKPAAGAKYWAKGYSLLRKAII